MLRALVLFETCKGLSRTTNEVSKMAVLESLEIPKAAGSRKLPDVQADRMCRLTGWE
jgi:hypothetical protein